MVTVGVSGQQYVWDIFGRAAAVMPADARVGSDGGKDYHV